MNSTGNLFDRDAFNQKFNDMAMLAKINTSDVLRYRDGDSTITLKRSLIDPYLAKGKNYIDSTADDYYDPEKDSEDRVSYIILLNKFTKKILVETDDTPIAFTVPHNFTKTLESYENASVRIFEEKTGIELDQMKLTNLLFATVKTADKVLRNAVYIAFAFKDPVVQTDSENSYYWMPIDQLTQYKDSKFNQLYKHIYYGILKNLY